MSQIVNDYTKGNLNKQLFRFSVPFMLNNILQILYSTVDMIIVGQFIGSIGLSAVSIGSQIMILMTAFCTGFSLSGQIMLANSIGEGNWSKTSKIIGSLSVLMLVIGVVMTFVTILFTNTFLHMLHTPLESFESARDYVIICGGGIIFSFGYQLVSATLRGLGNSIIPLVFISIASFINILLDIVFVRILKFGVRGAATATIIGQGASFIISLVYLYRNRERLHFSFKKKDMSPDKVITKKLICIGVPFALQNSTINISMLCVNGMVNSLGIYASAVFGAGNKLMQIPDTVGKSLSMAGASIIAQNIGACEFGRAKKTVTISLKINFVVYIISSILFLFFPERLFGIFTDESQVIRLSKDYILMYLLSVPAHIFLIPCNSFIKGIGNAKLTFFLSIADAFVLRVGLSWIIGVLMGIGLKGFFFGFHIATYGTAIPAAIYFYSGKWRNRF